MKDFLHKNMSEWFIDFFKRNSDKHVVFNDKKLLRLYDVINQEENLRMGVGYITRYISRKYKEKSFYIKNWEVVEWKENQGMDWHRDHLHYAATSIIFLNDDFEGGELITATDPTEKMKHLRTIHKPTKGTCVSFLGHTWHKVNPVTKGVRYTLAVWYHYV